MGNIKVIHEHSVDIDLLTGGICIDAGCRGFQFSIAMAELGCKVVAFDIEDMEAPEFVHFVQSALMPKYGEYYYVDTKDQQAKFISNTGIKVQGAGINEVYDDLMRDGHEVDILKLDVEGTEYFLLSDPALRPIPRQISIEFHMHAHRALHDQYYDKCMDNLLKYYEPVQHELTQAHGAGENYWDSLWIRKDLIQHP